MADDIDLPEPDRAEGAPHPRETRTLFGQAAAEEGFLRAWNQGRLHHAWLVQGPKGIGKATLVWRIARFILSQEPQGGPSLFGAPERPQTLDTDPESALARRLRALAEPRLFLLRRSANDKGNALSQVISVDDVRKMKSFFALSSADGGYRVAIIDCADEMNTSAANALLKLLEEPPAGAFFFLIAHQPAKLLPTIRSRCRELRLGPLAPEALSDALAGAGALVEPDMATPLAELALGSAGEAFRLSALDGLARYAELVALFETLPRLDRARALTMAEQAAARGQSERFDLLLTQTELFLTRLARAAARRETPPEAAPGEAALFARLAPDASTARPWAELAQVLTLRARRGKAVNLDPAALLMDIWLRVNATAAHLL